MSAGISVVSQRRGKSRELSVAVGGLSSAKKAAAAPEMAILKTGII